MNASPRIFPTVLKAVKPSGRLFQEARPFTNPKRVPAAPARLAGQFGRTAGTYVPLMVTFFSWPLVAKYVIGKTGGV